MAKALPLGKVELRLFAIFNVDARPEPFYNFPVFIMERYLPVQKHSVSSVRNLNPRFGFERFSAGQSRTPFLNYSI
jgi:hypothetical protein